MGKINIKQTLNKAVIYTKKYWKKPPEGEYLSLKEMTSYGMAQVGMFMVSPVLVGLSFGAAYFCGAIMNLQFMDFYKITLISTVMTYVLMFMNPIGVLIYENHGVLPKKTKIFANIVYLLEIFVAIALYCLPVNLFENVPTLGMVALPQIVANILLTNAITSYITWFIRVKFCAKHGRLKPFIVLCGIPAAILMSIIPYLPLGNAQYATKLVVLHFAFTLMNFFLNNFNNVGGLVTFMTPNSQERQKLYSIVPIITSLVPSVIGMFFPALIGISGGFTSLATYKIFVPIFSISGVVITTYFAMHCKERIIERHDEYRPKVKFWKGAKNVLQNKYLWITHLAGVVGCWVGMFGSVLQWWFVYSIRMEWFYGFAANIVVLSMTIGNLLTPWLIKKYQKRTILIGSRGLSLGTILLMFLAIKINSVVLFMFAVLLKNLLSPIDSGVSSGLNADALDYHQCKYGERADNMISIYSWLLNPVTMILGYVAPFLLSRIGFTSDWDVLYNQKIIADVFNIHIWLSFGSILATMVPFIFYDLTREKHDECIKKMQDDLRAATGETIDGDTRGDNTEGGSNEGGANPSETVVTA
ncbi:MAG: MFS transporter, partial [Clostridia bacterium]